MSRTAFLVPSMFALALFATTACGSSDGDDGPGDNRAEIASILDDIDAELLDQVNAFCQCNANLAMPHASIDACVQALQPTLGGPTRECFENAFQVDPATSELIVECERAAAQQLTTCYEGLTCGDLANSLSACQMQYQINLNGCPPSSEELTTALGLCAPQQG